MKKFTEFLNERTKYGKGKATLKDVPFMWFDDDVQDDLRRMGIKVTRKRTGTVGGGDRGTLATLTGTKKSLVLYLTGEDYGMDDRDLVDYYPELLEGFGAARRKGNSDALSDIRFNLRRQVKIFDQVEKEFKNAGIISTKIQQQTNLIEELGESLDRFSDALYSLHTNIKRGRK